MRILVTGATGFIGRPLCERLLSGGRRVVAITRTPGPRSVPWETRPLPHDAAGWAEAARGCDAVVNLAGSPIAVRWTEAARREMRTSRIDLTRSLVEGLARLPPGERPSVLVSSSAIGYYGTRRETSLGEDASPGDDFLARICADWEEAARRAESAGIRTVLLRIGIVLEADGGPLSKMLPPFKFGLGGPIAGGRQWMSWIHREDAIRMIEFALTDGGLHGPLNATAPDPKRNVDFGRALAHSLRRPFWFPIPAAMLHLGMGSAAVIVTTGQRVQPETALARGFEFRYPTLEVALRSVLGR